MKTVFQGIIGFDTVGNEWHVTIEQEDGYKIDLTARLAEIAYNLGKAQVGANYWIGPKRMTRDEMLVQILFAMYGEVTSETEHTTCYGSSMTGNWTESETTMQVGGHDLYAELSGHTGMFLYLEVVFPDREGLRENW